MGGKGDPQIFPGASGQGAPILLTKKQTGDNPLTRGALKKEEKTPASKRGKKGGFPRGGGSFL